MFLFCFSVVAAADIVDLSLSLYASVPLKAGISMNYPSSQCRGKHQLKLNALMEFPI